MPAVWGGWLADRSATTEAFAAYLNAPRDHFDDNERRLLEEDTARARAVMEQAWLEATPTRENPC